MRRRCCVKQRKAVGERREAQVSREPVHRFDLRPTRSTVAHSLRSIWASDGRPGPAPQVESRPRMKRRRCELGQEDGMQ